MSQDGWKAVDEYVDTMLVGEDEVLEQTLAINAEAGLPAIDVSPSQGKLLYLLAKLCGAQRILEVGTLGGYSTIWLARALPAGGQVVSIEYEQHHADVARSNIEAAGLSDRVDVLHGAGVDVLAKLEEQLGDPFDFVFLDADKPNNRNYLASAVALGRSGTLIVCDNVIRGGEVVHANSGDPSVIGSREAFDFVSNHPDLEATAFQTVGGKGHDGMIIARIK